jgi:hypothetical protein
MLENGAGAGIAFWLERRRGGALLASILPHQREWDCANGDEQKQVKCASDKMRFGTGV